MRHRPYKFITFFLALILACSSWIPLPLLADVQMRCAGAPSQAAPCAHAQLPAADLTEKQVYGTLMACCRSMQGGCAMVQNGPMRRLSHSLAAQGESPSLREAHSSRRCLVTIHISSPVSTPLSVQRSRLSLLASSTLTPCLLPPALVPPLRTVCGLFWTYTPDLSPHAAPSQHGLRAPPHA